MHLNFTLFSGNKRKLESSETETSSSTKKPRNPLSETTLNCSKSPRARLLREQVSRIDQRRHSCKYQIFSEGGSEEESEEEPDEHQCWRSSGNCQQPGEQSSSSSNSHISRVGAESNRVQREEHRGAAQETQLQSYSEQTDSEQQQHDSSKMFTQEVSQQVKTLF